MLGVDLVCDVYSPSGYAAHARELIRALVPYVDLRVVDRKHGVESVTLEPSDAELFARLERKTRRGQVRLELQTPEFFEPDPNALNVGFTHWETTRIPDTDRNGDARKNWVRQLNRMDAVFTSCELARRAFRESGVRTPSYTVRGPIDVRAYRPLADELHLEGITHREGRPVVREERPPVLAMVAQWTRRKDIPSFLETALATFKRGEVTILVKSWGPVRDADPAGYVRDRVARILAEFGDAASLPEVVVLTDPLPEAEMARLFSSIDVYVNTSRGEGLCLPLAQAMSSRCFPISCGFSAPADYVVDLDVDPHRGNGFLTDYTEVPASETSENPWYGAGQAWGQIDREHLASQMRRAVDLFSRDRARFDAVAERARATVLDAMSPETIGPRVAALLAQARREKFGAERRLVETL